jgi:hypothetical protein
VTNNIRNGMLAMYGLSGSLNRGCTMFIILTTYFMKIRLKLVVLVPDIKHLAMRRIGRQMFAAG